MTFLDPNTLWVLLACMLLGISSGVIGCFAFLRNRSLIGDALAHAALPGVCIMFLLTQIKSIGLFLIGAAIIGLLASYCITAISRHTRIKEDASIAIILSVFFGAGIMLLTYIQHSNSGNQSGLDKFLFGQAASLVLSDVYTMIAISAVLLLTTTLLFKEFTLLSFDSNFGRGLGFPMKGLDGILMLMILLCVVTGLQAVGVVLMSAMLITPAVTARYWTDKISTMVILAGVFGALSGVLGTYFSTQVNNLPTGPMIVLAATTFFLFSVIFSPKRGVVIRLVTHMKVRKKVLQEDVLQVLYESMEYELKEGYSIDELAKRSGKSITKVQRAIEMLKSHLFVHVDQTGIQFTKTGLQKAHEIVLNERVWDVYYMNELDYQGFNIDKGQENIITQLNHTERQTMFKRLEDYEMMPNLLAFQANVLSDKKRSEVSL
ncbi:metal ABC transporter permease [Priestia taiwanensis]|uniref:Manganese transport system membrane protein MntC n=1 Tax=Priestia taiwanensis TaxID=1347902 RepID=A0A917EQK6_9BACI|nr:metal ABC transporter permease [Priestia taiwanensis]MBM7363004.1 manganese/zinc/iron transport system permease protein [Priestia taiwanensis]GGE66867.1 manganese transport system membrane protein MntC [Priestia taiwanensis]